MVVVKLHSARFVIHNIIWGCGFTVRHTILYTVTGNRYLALTVLQLSTFIQISLSRQRDSECRQGASVQPAYTNVCSLERLHQHHTHTDACKSTIHSSWFDYHYTVLLAYYATQYIQPLYSGTLFRYLQGTVLWLSDLWWHTVSCMFAFYFTSHQHCGMNPANRKQLLSMCPLQGLVLMPCEKFQSPHLGVRL